MSANIPDLTISEFSSRLANCHPDALEPATLQRLYIHYTTLRQWNSSVSLVGPGTRSEIVERHYGESLAGLALLPEDTRTVVDIGSGGGFPGIILASARPDLQITLIEPRQRKWAFLKTVCRRASLSCHPLNARVGATLPEGFPASVDLLTVRALRLTPSMVSTLRRRLSNSGVLLLWGGRELPSLPDDFVETGSIALPNSTHRRIIRLGLTDS